MIFVLAKFHRDPQKIVAGECWWFLDGSSMESNSCVFSWRKRGLTNGKHHPFSISGDVCMMLKYDRKGLKMIRANIFFWLPDFFSGWWLTYLSEKYESIGIIIPNLWKNMFQTTNQYFTTCNNAILKTWGSFPPILTIQCSNSDTSPHNEKWLKRNESSRSLSAEPVRTYTTGERYFRNTAMATFSTSAGKQLLGLSPLFRPMDWDLIPNLWPLFKIPWRIHVWYIC